jgi:hypothetical protein
MTNFQQPAWTLNTPRGSNQETQYSHLPSTETTNYDAFGRNNVSTFEYVVMYPSGKRGFQSGFSNVRPTTVTAAQNVHTGSHLYNSVNSADPRVDNTKDEAYKLANMDIQKSTFLNKNGALIAAGALIAVVILAGGLRKRR